MLKSSDIHYVEYHGKVLCCHYLGNEIYSYHVCRPQSTYIPGVPHCLSPHCNWDTPIHSPASERVPPPPPKPKEGRTQSPADAGGGGVQIRTT
jgi:hypothetical protein